RPLTFKPFYTKHKDKTLRGVQIYITDSARANLLSLQFILMDVHNELYPDKNPFTLAEKSRISMFDKVCGGDEVRKAFTRRMKYEDVKPFLDGQVEAFRAKARKYYLYQ